MSGEINYMQLHAFFTGRVIAQAFCMISAEIISVSVAFSTVCVITYTYGKP